jgi:membrane protein YqaA with SNARE-associated domain
MLPSYLPHWLQALAGVSGGLALFVVAFLDSSFIPFPSFNDLMLIALSVQNPIRMPYYAGMVTLGSLLGCLVLYAIARKGGEVAFGARGGPHSARVQRWIKRNGFLSIAIGSLLPPPAPFKVIVLAAGAFDVRLRTFVLALVFARALRFYGEGYLAVRYGAQAYAFLVTHKLSVAAVSMAIAAGLYLLGRLLSPKSKAPTV